MAFLAPAIGTLVGGVAATAVGQAVIGLGLSVGLGYLARRLQPKPNTSAQGMRLSLRLEPNSPREICFGEFASAGTLEYHNTYGPNGNDYLQLVFAIADHECDGLSSVFVDGVACAIGDFVSNANVSGYAVAGFEDCLWLQFYNGAFDQEADADLVSKSTHGEWTSTERGAGVAYVRATMKANAQKFKSGQPRLLFVVRGIKLYDPRKDSSAGGSGAHRWGTPSTYEYTRNPIICAYNYRRGIYVGGSKLGGMNATLDALPLAPWAAAANVCDENVALRAGGFEKRYQMSGVVAVTEGHTNVLREMITAAGGIQVDSGGVFKPYAGAAQSPVMTITDADLMPGTVQHVPKLSRSGLINAVFGTYISSANIYEATALPPRISPADAEADGGSVLQEHYGLAFVTSATQGQRITEILRRKNRYQRTVACRLRSRFAVLEVGDWVTWESERYGFNATFEIVQATLDRDLSIAVELKEIAADVYAWIPAVDELDPLSPAEVGSGGARLTLVAGVALANTLVLGAGSEQRPGLRVTWTPVTDTTVVRLDLEFRKVGDSVAQQRQIVDASAGSYTWIDGVLGGVTYEARLKPVALPDRQTTWSAWVSVPAVSEPQIVSVAGLALAVPPDTISPEMLTPQARFEIGLTTALADVQGSVENRLRQVVEEIQTLAAAQLTHRVFTDQSFAAVRKTEARRQTDREAFASYVVETDAVLNDPVTGLPATASAVSGLESRVTATEDGIEAAEARAFLGVNVNGQVIGTIDLYANVLESVITLLSNRFVVARPDGTGVKQIFTTGEVNGVPDQIGLFGDVFIDGTILARHISVGSLTAISAEFGDAVVTGQLTGGPGGKLILDLTNGNIRALA